MFLAPLLYVLHALLTGLAMVIMNALGVHLGFSFSAGLFDYMLNFSLATRPLWLLPIGLGYFALYYGLFRYGIVRFNLATPGRDATADPTPEPSAPGTGAGRAAGIVAALGGATNLTTVDACTTRLRLSVVESARIDVAALTRLGAMGVVRPGPNSVQVVLGPIADQVAGEIRRHLQADAGGATAGQDRSAAKALSAPAMLAALGGAINVGSVDIAAGRLLIGVREPKSVDLNALSQLGVRDAAISRAGVVHVLLGLDTDSAGASLRALVARGK
jgi:PTS system N-acetylglucosamine-specific IIC component